MNARHPSAAASVRRPPAGPTGRRPAGGKGRAGCRTLSALLAGLLALLAMSRPVFPGGSATAEDDLRAEAERATRDNGLLQKRVELATGDSFYLLLDPGAGDVKLMLKGAVLQDYAVQGLEIGEPRRAFVAGGLPDDWEGRIWSKGTLDPGRPQDRLEVDASPAGDAEPPQEVPIPPTPEEKFPVPPRYRIKYDGGLSLEVRPREMDETATAWQRLRTACRVWWRDALAVAGGHPEDTIRLRLVLRPADADSLYRALPPDTRLLILPPA
jgi:hypothetical protein